MAKVTNLAREVVESGVAPLTNSQQHGKSETLERTGNKRFMAGEAMADAVPAIAIPVNFNPFYPKNESRPDQRYWCDRGVWDAYQASMSLVIQGERDRFRRLIQNYAKNAPTNIRTDLFDLIKEI
jgi:hypothetical protein